MLRRFKSRLPAIAMAGLLILGLSERAHADLSVTLLGAPPAQVAGNFVLPVNLSNGVVNVVGTAEGETFLLVPSAMDLSLVSVTATAPTTATVIFGQDMINSPVGMGSIFEQISAHFITGSGNISYQTFGTNGNFLYTSLPLIPAPTGMTGVVNTLNGSSSGAFTATAPYTLTEVLTINFTSAGVASISTDSSAHFSPAPEPMAMALAGIGALGFIAYGLRRRKASGA